MKTVRQGQFYTITRKNTDYHQMEANSVVYVVDIDSNNNGLIGNKKSNNNARCLDVKTGTVWSIPESELSTRFSSENIVSIKKYFKKQLDSLGMLEECMTDLQKEDITPPEYMLWVLTKVGSNQGSTKTQKIKAIQDFVDAL